MANHPDAQEIAATIARWRAQARHLSTQVVQLHVERQLWRTTVDAIAERTVSRLWPNHYTGLYVSAQVISLRRIIRGRRSGGVVSFGGLLREMHKGASSITLDSLMSRDTLRDVPSLVVQAERDYLKRTWFDDNLGHIRPDLPERDRNRLLRSNGPPLGWADTVVAHTSDSPDDTPTFQHVEDAISMVTETANRYRRLLLGIDGDVSNIMFIDADWRDVFDRPLFPGTRD